MRAGAIPALDDIIESCIRAIDRLIIVLLCEPFFPLWVIVLPHRFAVAGSLEEAKARPDGQFQDLRGLDRAFCPRDAMDRTTTADTTTMDYTTMVGQAMGGRIDLPTSHTQDKMHSCKQSPPAIRSNRSKTPYTPTPFVLMAPRVEDMSITGYSLRCGVELIQKALDIRNATWMPIIERRSIFGPHSCLILSSVLCVGHGDSGGVFACPFKGVYGGR